MGANFENVPEAVQDHIRAITKSSGLPDTEESYETIAAAWIEKRGRFEERIAENKMSEIDEYAVDEERGALLLTYSGSLITIGPFVDGARSVEYNSIGLRQDVPESAHADDTSLTDTITIDTAAAFTNGPIKKSSAVYAIAINPDDLSNDEEDALLTSITEALVEDFVEVNKTIVVA